MSTEMIIGYILGQISETPQQMDFLTMIIGIILIGVWALVAFYLCWDVGQISMHEIAKVIWAILFVIGPIISWIAYFLIVKKGTTLKTK